MNGNVDVVMALLDAGADASIEDESGYMAMNYAEFRGFDSLAQFLAPKSVSAKCTPESIFDAIIAHDYTQLALLCTKFGANYYDDAKYYPLHYALRKKRTDAVPTLLKCGADLSVRSKGSQALHIAADKGLDNAVKYLLRHGADVNDKNTMNGYTPLHYAVTKGHCSTITLLMQNGADPMMQTNRGATVLEMALGPTGREAFSALMAGGLLKKLKGNSVDTLLEIALQARRFNLSFMLTVSTKKSWEPLARMHNMANPQQMKVLTKKYPERGIQFIQESLEERRQNAWAALDAM